MSAVFENVAHKRNKNWLMHAGQYMRKNIHKKTAYAQVPEFPLNLMHPKAQQGVAMIFRALVRRAACPSKIPVRVAQVSVRQGVAARVAGHRRLRAA
jgi:hypothetical protein